MAGTNRTLYEVFVAEFFLTQTPDDNVAAVYPVFLERFPTLNTITDTSESELVEVIEPLGFQNMRTGALQQIASTHDRLTIEPEPLCELCFTNEYCIYFRELAERAYHYKIAGSSSLRYVS
ncbi:hypothetical protein [Haloferax volcanii]|uniref:hypothetical protein n=1 Tax=Haloferax volcanii TaxID=2246 RepID=UPI001EF96AC8|nr:hypothetical protein [Haloferax alexandrinus]